MKVTATYRTIVLGLLTWVLVNIIQLKSDVAVLQSNVADMKQKQTYGANQNEIQSIYTVTNLVAGVKPDGLRD